jgi:single-strand DNA-binding protein
MNMQKLLLLGRATGDAELVDAKNGKPFITFSLAVNRYLGKEKGEEAQFYDCMIFGKKESMKKGVAQIKKGAMLLLDGRPEAEAYLSKGGEAKAQIKVMVNEWQLLK